MAKRRESIQLIMDNW